MSRALEEKMELLSVQRARSIWLFDAYDLNPHGKELGSLIAWLRDRYKFQKVPAHINDLDESKALYYAGGQFQIKRDFISVDLRIYGDGIVADTRSSTDDTDLFLFDVLQSAAKEFALAYRPEIVRKRLYVSEITVRCAIRLEAMNPKLEKFTEKLTAATGAKVSSKLASIAFWRDILPNPSASVFRFERKWGAEFSENRYFSRAPLQTDKHLELLEELEKVFS
jgi:hypothetical protein